MWARDYHQRLLEWQRLRESVADSPKPQCLDAVNRWWFGAPWSSYHLHWDDRDKWPDPWQLLQDNIFCSVARGLGILYTVSLLQRADITDVEMIDTDLDNLVLVDSGIYVLNWEADTIVNISLDSRKSKRRITLSEINQLIL